MVDIAVDADEVIKEMQRNQAALESTIDTKKQIQSQEQELDKIKNLLADLYPDFKTGLINADQYRINKEKYEQKQLQLQANINSLKSALDSSAFPHKTNAFVEHFKRPGNINALTRSLLTELVDSIAVHQDGTLDISFNFCETLAKTDQINTSIKYNDVL